MDDLIRHALRLARSRLQSGGVPEGVPDEASQEAFLKEQLAGSAPQYEPEAGMLTAKKAGLMAAGMAPGMGIASAVGEFPTAEGGKEPSMAEDWRKGEYLSAGLKGLGAAGDVVSAVPVVGTAVGTAMKAPLAAKLAMAVAPMAKVAGEVAPLVEAAPRVTNPIGMYSAAAEAARSLPQEKGSLQQMLATMKGVSPEEIQWSGVNEAFAGRPSVTREELAKHFEGRLPGVEEKVYFNEPIKGSGWESVEGGTKFNEYTIPGGENYREVVMHLPHEIDKRTPLQVAQQLFENPNLKSIYDLDFDSFRILQKELNKQYKENFSLFGSSHWDQPNVLAHLRMSDRVGPEGTKDLHLEELQSDWGQKGRKEGFGGLNSEEQKELEILESKNSELFKQMKNADDNQFDELNAQRQPLLARIEELNKKAEIKTPSAPYVTSTAGWTDLGLKRALQEAVNGGYDRLLITPGAEQAARYDLSKHIQSVSYNPNKNYLSAVDHNGRSVINESGVEPKDLDQYIGKELADKLRREAESATSVFEEYDIVRNPETRKWNLELYGEPSYGYGGELLEFDTKYDAQQHLQDIINEEIERNPPTLSDLDLKVGGEGMKSFYDKIVPNQLNKILKKIDKDAKLKLHAHPLEGKEGEVRAHVLEITPKMREAIKKGFAAYADGGEVSEKPTKNHDSTHLNAVSKRGMAISNRLERQKGGKVMDDVEKALSLSKNMMKKRNVSHETKKNNKKYADGGEIPLPPRRPLEFLPMDARSAFPHLMNVNDPMMKISLGRQPMYSETYPPGETGDPENPNDIRPKEFPLNRTGIEVYDPREKGADYALELLHTDPRAVQAREKLKTMITPQQREVMKDIFMDYDPSKVGEERGFQNAVDATMRSYLAGRSGVPSEQAPLSALDEIDFTPEERKVLEDLYQYSQHGDIDSIHDLEFTPEEMEVMKNLQPFVEGAQGIKGVEAAPMEEERKLGGKVNTIIDRDPDWRMGLQYGGVPDEDLQGDERYKAFQQIGGTRVDPRSEAIGRFLPKMTYHESRNNPLAGAKTSSAAGLAQFTKPTWRAMTQGEPEVAGKGREEIAAMRRDPTTEGQQFHMRMAEKLANQNADMLEKAGLPVTPQNLYAAHFGGPHGVRAAAAPAGMPLNRIFNRQEIKANPFLRGKTAEGFRNFTQKAMSETPSGLPQDLEFQRAQLPTNRFQNLQTAMSGAPDQAPLTQMAYQQPAAPTRVASSDLGLPRPVQRPVVAQDMRRPQIEQAGLPVPQRNIQQAGPINIPPPARSNEPPIPIQQAGFNTPEQPEMPRQNAVFGDLQTPDNMPMDNMPMDNMAQPQTPDFEPPDFLQGLEHIFASGGVVSDALRLATGGRTPAWQRKEGKNPEGGLNAKGRASYNRANPGKPGLKPPAPHPKTEKDANRRKSFCARMSGMPGAMKDEKGRPTRKALSLRAWNCADGGVIDDATNLAKGGPIWNKPRPKRLGKPDPLTPSQKTSAKAAAKAAGRPYPNMIDNLNAAKKGRD